MKKIFILIFLILSGYIFSQEITGTWVNSAYNKNAGFNYLDVITINKISDNNYYIQHSYYYLKERDYMISASKIEENKITFEDPLSGWTIILSTRMWGPNKEVLEWYPDFDPDFVGQYIRINDDFISFIENIDLWIQENEQVPK